MYTEFTGVTDIVYIFRNKDEKVFSFTVVEINARL